MVLRIIYLLQNIPIKNKFLTYLGYSKSSGQGDLPRERGQGAGSPSYVLTLVKTVSLHNMEQTECAWELKPLFWDRDCKTQKQKSGEDHIPVLEKQGAGWILRQREGIKNKEQKQLCGPCRLRWHTNAQALCSAQLSFSIHSSLFYSNSLVLSIYYVCGSAPRLHTTSSLQRLLI